jgi:hypothetical protein
MNQSSALWQLFVLTGSISAYLSYRSVLEQEEEKVQADYFRH